MRIRFIGVLVLIGIIVITLYSFNSAKYITSSLTSFKANSISIPADLHFAGERVPVEYFDVRESLDREIHVNTYFHSQTILLIKRSARFFPEMEKILKEEGVPDDFKYLAAAESGLQNVVSPSKAAGFWQFLKKTAEEYDLIVNDEIDERYHLQKATRAACQFLKESYDIFGSWTLASASYNMGKSNLKKVIDQQKQDNYYNLYFNDETARYIFRILALKLIISSPQQFGFMVDSSDLYRPWNYRELMIDSTITNLSDFAINQGSNYKMLVILNPWIKSNSLTKSNSKSYIIRIVDEVLRKEN